MQVRKNRFLKQGHGLSSVAGRKMAATAVRVLESGNNVWSRGKGGGIKVTDGAKFANQMT